MCTKRMYVDETGTAPVQRDACTGYFALAVVALNDADALQPALQEALAMLPHQVGTTEADRTARRGYFHASEDTPVVRRWFLSFLSGVNFHCRVAVFHPVFSPPAKTCYDSLVREVFAEMLPPGFPADTMEVVVALRGAQSAITGKGAEYESLFSSVRKHLEERFPAIADLMPEKHPVKHVGYRDEPCLQLPDYCGWAVRRCLANNDPEWLRLLHPEGPGWHYEQGELVLPPDRGALYVTAGQVTGIDFFCG